jgi:RNA polymerase sigma factor (sigma-70 family)
MSTTKPSPIRDFLRLLVADPRVAACSDRELLGHFLTGKDEAAFEEIVRRHGPMVFDVCRTMLANAADAEDAFQATFLILARKAASIRNTTSLASWLHGVAYRTACQARTQFARRQRHEARCTAREVSEAEGDLSWREVQAVIHQELASLPDRSRLPLVLCYLQGKTQEAVAAELGIAKSTLRERLDHGRSLLRARLEKRGFGPAALLLTSAWPTAGFSAHVPITLASETLRITSSGGTAAAKRVIELTHGVLHAMQIKKTVATVAALSAVAFVGFFLPASVWSPAGPASALPVAAAAPAPKPRPDGERLWVLNDITFELKAYSPEGKVVKEFKLPEGNRFLGLTPDGEKIAFAGKKGKVVGPKETAELTVHLRDLGTDTEGTDTRLDYRERDHLVWSPDAGRVVRGRVIDPADLFSAHTYTLYDVASQKSTELKLPAGHIVCQWAPDGAWLLVCSGGGGIGVGYPNWYKLTLADGKVSPIATNFPCYRADVSPDGRSLIGYAHRVDKTAGEPRWDRRLVRIDIATGIETTLRKFTEPTGYGYGWARWSPDGKRLAFWCSGPNKTGLSESLLLSICNANTGERKTSAEIPTNAWVLQGWFPASGTNNLR